MIGLKKRREEVLSNVQCHAQMAAKSAGYAMTGQPITDAVAQMIGAAVAAGIEQMLKDMYSQEDLEQDLQLK